MAIVPMRQEITVKRGGPPDEWGNPLPDEKVIHKCRVDEGTFLVEYRASSNVSSREVVAKARIILDKLVDIRYSDEIIYTNELDQDIKQSPKKINVKRHINGKPILTEVFI